MTAFDLPMSMFTLPEVASQRLVSLSWIDENDDFHCVPICTLNDVTDDIKFTREFDKRGILYERTLKAARVNLNSSIRSLRPIITVLPHLNFSEADE